MTDQNESLPQLEQMIEDTLLEGAVWFIKAIVLFLLFFILLKVIKKIDKKITEKLVKHGFSQSLISIVTWLVENALVIFVIMKILVALELFKAATIAAAIAAMGLGISMALQGALGNFAGGILLMLLKPFKEGDYIIVDSGEGIEGTVSSITVYYTTIINDYNEKINVPNSALTNDTIINQVSNNCKHLELHANIGYEEDVDKALGVMRKIVGQDDRIKKERQEFFVDELGAHSIILGVRCIVESKDYLKVKWDLNRSILIAFDENDIHIPYEQLDVHITN